MSASTSVQLTIRPLADEEIDAVVALWTRCGLTRPWNDPRADIMLARRGANSIVLVAVQDGGIVASTMVGHDGHRGWVYYVAVEPDRQDGGLGRAVMRAAEDWLRARGIAKVMLMVRPENERVRGFYAALGYRDEPRVVFSKWLDGRDPT